MIDFMNLKEGQIIKNLDTEELKSISIVETNRFNCICYLNQVKIFTSDYYLDGIETPICQSQIQNEEYEYLYNADNKFIEVNLSYFDKSGHVGSYEYYNNTNGIKTKVQKDESNNILYAEYVVFDYNESCKIMFLNEYTLGTNPLHRLNQIKYMYILGEDHLKHRNGSHIRINNITYRDVYDLCINKYDYVEEFIHKSEILNLTLLEILNNEKVYDAFLYVFDKLNATREFEYITSPIAITDDFKFYINFTLNEFLNLGERHLFYRNEVKIPRSKLTDNEKEIVEALTAWERKSDIQCINPKNSDDIREGEILYKDADSIKLLRNISNIYFKNIEGFWVATKNEQFRKYVEDKIVMLRKLED